MCRLAGVWGSRHRNAISLLFMFNVINGSWLQRQLAEKRKVHVRVFCENALCKQNQFSKNCKRGESRDIEREFLCRRQKVVFVLAGAQRTQQSGGKLAGARQKSEFVSCPRATVLSKRHRFSAKCVFVSVNAPENDFRGERNFLR